MNTKYHLFSYFVSLTNLLALSLTGCSRASSKTAQPDDVQLTNANNGGQLTVKVGQMISLRLEANPSTGFGWELSNATPITAMQDRSKETDPCRFESPTTGLDPLISPNPN